MSLPKATDGGVLFELGALARELCNDETYAREGHAARTLIRSSDLRIVLIAIQAGKTISEHRANVTASVQALSGRLRLQLPDRNAEVPAGHLLVLGPGLRHDVHAEEDSTFLLTLGWPASE